MSGSPTNRNADWNQLEKLYPLYIGGDLRATNTLFLSLKKALEGYFVARLNSKADAEDLTQAALLKLHFSRDRFDTSKSLKTWVFTVASRTLIDHWRGNSTEEKHRARPKGQDDEGSVSLDELEQVASEVLGPDRKTELHLDLNQALETLKPIDRSIVYLYGVEGLSMAEIAEIHSITESATKVRAHRAYHELRKLMVCLAFLALIWEVYGRN